MDSFRKFALVGLGGRSEMYQSAVGRDFADKAGMVALCDGNPGRLEVAQDALQEMTGAVVPAYDSADFERMITEQEPDCIIVTTIDRTHHDYICRAMELGCDVITEKPMTMDAEKCRQILETKRRTGRTVTVTFNYRYAPPRAQVKDLLMQGVIGDVLSVDFHWLLDVRHGADYFRRWHRNKKNSGGLLVHKATHHFDLVNWWLSTVPERVYASGHRKFYTPETADRYDLQGRSDRCHTCPKAERCPFRISLKDNPNLRKLYLDCEQHDGYQRDKCVFSDQIDIEDSMNVVVDYQSGTKMTYSLNAFSPWEGYIVSFNGTKGRLEHKCQEKVYVSADGSTPGALDKEGTWTHIYPHWQPAYGVDIWTGSGGHGGADPVMLQYIFDPENQSEDKYMRKADERSGAWSILTGVAANQSMKKQRPVDISELVDDIGMPDYPPMPSSEDPLPVPEKSADDG